jgi:hypothetical protein
MTLKSHALADVFPTLDGTEFARLVDDIKTNAGLVHQLRRSG